MLQTNPTCHGKYIALFVALCCYSVFFQQYGSWVSIGTLRSSQQTVVVLEARNPEDEKVPGGKHDAVSVDPHPSPWFPNMTVSPTSDGRPLASEDGFYTSTWPPLRKVMCGEGAPNLHLSSMLFKLARDEVFLTNPTRPLETMNTSELEQSIEEERPTSTAEQFFSGNWGMSALDGNYTQQDSGKLTLFKTRYVRVWKAGNNQIRALEEDLAKELGISDYQEEVRLRKKEFQTENGIEPCIYTVIRDPIQHFLSGYNEIEFRTFRTHTWPEAPYHTDLPYNKTDDHKKRFRAFVEDLLVEDGSFLVNSVYSHCFSMSRVLSSLAKIGRQLNGYLADLADLTQRWPEFLTNTCPGLPPLESFPKPKVNGQHQSSKDPWGTYKASKEVWAEGGPIARALCLLSAPDYACFEDLPEGIPEFCQTVYKDHAQTLIDYGQKHYIDLANLIVR